MKITYLFREGRLSRSITETVYPTEFFYGYPQLMTAGFQVKLLEDVDIGMGHPLPTTARFLNKFSCFFGDLPLGMASSLLFPGFRKRLPKEGLIVATTNGMGLALGLGRLMGLVRVRVLLLAMGVLPHDASNWKRWLVLKLAHQLDIVTISRPEQEALQSLLPNQEIGYLPFGVDCDFWFPNDEHRHGEEYVLAIGNDLNRDWETLVALGLMTFRN